MPPLPEFYHRMAAAKSWGIPWDEFLRKPMERRAEMIAFVKAEAIVHCYEREKLKEAQLTKDANSANGGGFYNPMAAQRAAMNLPPL